MNSLSRMLGSIMIGYRDKRLIVCVPRSKISLKILNLFYYEGFIKGFSLDEDVRNLIVFLNYVDHKPMILGFQRLSFSSRKIYLNSKNFLKFINKNGFFVLSTSNFGFVLSNRLFAKNRVLNLFHGGEVLFKIFV